MHGTHGHGQPPTATPEPTTQTGGSMTTSMLLSARIAALEARVRRGQESALLHASALQRRAALDLEIDEFAVEMDDGGVAGRLLEHLQATLTRAEQTGDVRGPDDAGQPALVIEPVPAEVETPIQHAPPVVQHPPPASSGPTTEPTQESEYVSDRQRVLDVIAATPPSQLLTVADITGQLDITAKNAGNYLSQACRDGLLTREPGTGTPKVPSVYRVVGGGETLAPVQAEEEAPSPALDVTSPPAPEPAPDPAPATPVQSAAPDPEPEDSEEGGAALRRPNAPARLLEVLQREPTRAWTAVQLSIEADADHAQVSRSLAAMVREHTVIVLPGSPLTYCLERPAPAVTQPLPPIPAKLNPDEVSMIDLLRHAESGLTQRVLQSRLNWSTSRTDKTVQRLLRDGHVGQAGDRLRVLPADLGQAAV